MSDKWDHNASYDRDGKPMPDLGIAGKQSGFCIDRRVGRTNINGKYTVSTVWLSGIDHAWHPDDPPLLFETMVFGEPYDQVLRRYGTEEQAMRGHLETVDRLRDGLTPFADWASDE